MTAETDATACRNLPGTNARDCFTTAPWVAEQTYASFTGQFQAQEYIQYLIRKRASDILTICTLPSGADQNIWILEHLRICLADLNGWVVGLGEVCTADTCPSMIATADWEFLCAAHPNQPRKCCAIDYIIHTLTGFTALLNNHDHFPNRVRIPPKSTQYFGALARRLYRVYAHAYYHHRETFDRLEQENHLCARFMGFSLLTGLMNKKQLTPMIELDTIPKQCWAVAAASEKDG